MTLCRNINRRKQARIPFLIMWHLTQSTRAANVKTFSRVRVHRCCLMARLVGVATTAENLHEERESSICRCDQPDDRRASPLSSTPHAPLQKSRRLPRKGKTSPSVHRQQVDTLQPATEIQFNTPIETTASDGEKQLQLCTLLLKRAERHSPHKQRPASAHHQHTEDKGPTGMPMTNRSVQCLSRAFHQPAARWQRHRARMPKGWVSARSPCVKDGCLRTGRQGDRKKHLKLQAFQRHQKASRVSVFQRNQYNSESISQWPEYPHRLTTAWTQVSSASPELPQKKYGSRGCSMRHGDKPEDQPEGHRYLTRQQEWPMAAKRPQTKVRKGMLVDTEPSKHRAKAPADDQLTSRRVQRSAHQPAASCIYEVDPFLNFPETPTEPQRQNVAELLVDNGYAEFLDHFTSASPDVVETMSDASDHSQPKIEVSIEQSLSDTESIHSESTVTAEREICPDNEACTELEVSAENGITNTTTEINHQIADRSP
ncbi:hypothetical protein HPB50_028875 [Hyalomma asiaticum]|nr:hypothetical protein HPB50_028875 [Hyalomma asiaticum]